MEEPAWPSSSWNAKELDTTERLYFSFFFDLKETYKLLFTKESLFYKKGLIITSSLKSLIYKVILCIYSFDTFIYNIASGVPEK